MLCDFQSQASSFPILPERFQARPNILPNFKMLKLDGMKLTVSFFLNAHVYAPITNYPVFHAILFILAPSNNRNTMAMPHVFIFLVSYDPTFVILDRSTIYGSLTEVKTWRIKLSYRDISSYNEDGEHL